MISTVTSNAAAETVTLGRRRGEHRIDGPETAARGSRRPQPKQRRRHIDPTTCERDYRQDELDFMRAMDDYKCSSGRMFPTCSEVLEVLRSMGYVRLTAEQRERFGETLEPAEVACVAGSDDDDDVDMR